MRNALYLPQLIFLTCECLMVGASVAGVPADAIQPKSVWRDEERRILTILERNGDTYRGRYEIGGNIVREVTGAVKGNQISWLSKDVRAVKGNPGGDNFGTIIDDRIEFKWTDSKNGSVHNFTLVRVPDGNGQKGIASTPVTSSPAQGPKTLEEALVSFKWSWNNPKKESNWKEVQFKPDGTLIATGGDGKLSAAKWQITGGSTVVLDGTKTLHFDPAFVSFSGINEYGNPFTGTRQGAIPSASQPPPAVASNSHATLLETLSQEAPNASVWVLAPLDRSVSPDIRQNLTYLREDLLDEAKEKPKASAEAYKLGGQLCNTMIAALDERDQALVRAGFRAVEAQARTGVTSQTLEARRNYKMSWPQFAREESQRSELKSQAINSAAVIAERPKVEWATRTDQIRPMLDKLYAQFREALRQSPAVK